MSSIKVVSLNCGRGLEGFDRQVEFLHEGEWDVVCLQDVQGRHLDELLPPEKFKARYFKPMTNHIVKHHVRSEVGVAIISRHGFVYEQAYAYLNKISPVLDMAGVEVDFRTGKCSNHDLAVFRPLESRLILFAGVEVGDQIYNIGTTHGTWVPNGISDEVQLESMRLMCKIISDQPYPMVMIGDFNTDKDGKVDAIFRESLRNEMPPEIDTTLDPGHPASKKGIKAVPDRVMTRSKDRYYTIRAVCLHSGVSDHCALSAEISIA